MRSVSVRVFILCRTNPLCVITEARFYIPCLTVLPIVFIALNSNMTNNNSMGEGKVRIVTTESLRTLADNKRLANV